MLSCQYTKHLISLAYQWRTIMETKATIENNIVYDSLIVLN
jgi:hypothetical protein